MASDMEANRNDTAEDATVWNQKDKIKADKDQVVIDLGNGAMVVVEEKEKKVDYGVILNRYSLRDIDESKDNLDNGLRPHSYTQKTPTKNFSERDA